MSCEPPKCMFTTVVHDCISNMLKWTENSGYYHKLLIMFKMYGTHCCC